MATAPPATAGPPAITPLIVFPRSLTWEELFATADWVSTSPAVPYYGVLSAAIFNSADPLETLLNKLEQTALESPMVVALLNKLEQTALESPMVVALVSDEDLNWITLLKNNPRCIVGSLVHPTALDGLMYSFLGPDTQRLWLLCTSQPVPLRLVLPLMSWTMLP